MMEEKAAEDSSTEGVICYAWGSNSSGVLGLGHWEDVSVPTISKVTKSLVRIIARVPHMLPFNSFPARRSARLAEYMR